MPAKAETTISGAMIADSGIDPKGALDQADRALFRARTERAPLSQADALASRAGALLALDRSDDAQQSCDAALALLASRQDISAQQIRARTLLIRNQVATLARRYDEALPQAQSTLALTEAVFPAGSIERAQARAEVAALLQSLGKGSEALPLAMSAWAEARAIRPAGLSARLQVAMTLASIHSNARRSNEAEALIREALSDGLSLPPGHAVRVQILNRLGYEMLIQGRLNEAIPYLRQAVDEGHMSPAVPRSELANYVGVLGIALLNQDQPEEAAPILANSLALFDAAGVSAGKASILISAGTARDRSGDRAGGLMLREQAIALLGASPKPSPLTMALARFKLGQSYAHLGRLDEAQAIEAQAVEGIAALRPDGHFQRLNSSIALGWIEGQRGDPAAGLLRVKPAFARMQEENQKLEVAQNQVVGVLDNIEALSQALDAAARAHDLPFAFQVMQVLVESDASRAAIAAQARMQAGGTELGALLRQRQEAAASALEKDTAAIRAAADAAPDAAARRSEADEAARALAAIGADLDRRFPTYRTLLRPQAIALDQLRRKLKPGEAALLTVASDEGLFTMAVTRDNATIGKSPLRRHEVRQLVARLRASIDGEESFDVAAAKTLHDAIFTAEVAMQTRRVRRLIVAPDDILSALPFSLLAVETRSSVNDTHWLIEDKAISVAPSLSAIGDTLIGKSQNRRFLGIGAPDLSGSGALSAGPSYYAAGITRSERLRAMPPLPAARLELERIANILSPDGGVTLLTGGQAQEASLRKADLEKLSVLAFATHGLVAGEFDRFSEPALIFTPPADAGADAQNDGMLTASEAALLHIDADWVILSACNTAAGSRPSAAGYGGLARAFLFAGGRRVLASHWPVRDDVAADLTVFTVEGARRGLAPAEALRQAMLRVMHDKTRPDARNPALWAPFMLVGN